MPGKRNMGTGPARSGLGHCLFAGEFGKAISRMESCVRLAAILFLLFNFQAPSSAAAAAPREYQIKANWLLQFSYYVEWPPAALASKETPLVIGILGSDPFRQALEKLLEKKVGGREVKMLRFDSIEKLKDCHILYVNLPDQREVQRALDALRGKPILTVSDGDEFSHQGGMISLLKFKNHLKPHINNAAARRASLVIDSRLLAVSEVTDK
jgi:hypothetical protein